MLRCPGCDHQAPLKDASVRLSVAALMNHYHRNCAGADLPPPPFTPQLLAAISTSTPEFLTSFAQENGLEAKETEDLLKAFKRTKLDILCRLSKEDIRDRIDDVELAQLLYFKIQDALSVAATQITSEPPKRRKEVSQDPKVVDDEKHLSADDHPEQHETEVYSKIMSSLGRVKTLGSSLSATFATTLEDSFEVETEEAGNLDESHEPTSSWTPSSQSSQSSTTSSTTPTPTTAASVFAAAATTVSTLGSPLASFFQNLTHPSVPPSPMKSPATATSTHTPTSTPPRATPTHTSRPVTPTPPKSHNHSLSPLLSPIPPPNLESGNNCPVTPTVKTETPVASTSKKPLFESTSTPSNTSVPGGGGNMEGHIQGILSHTNSEPENTNGMQYSETAPKLLSSKIATIAQNQKKLASKFLGYTVKKSSDVSGAAAKLMDTRGQALKKKATTKVQSMFVGKPEPSLNNTPPKKRSNSHIIATTEPCILCNQVKEPNTKKFLPLNCVIKHNAVVCIPCLSTHLSGQYKNNQPLICPVTDCGSEIVPKDIDALKNIGVCDDSLQYKMHMEKLKTESRKVLIQES